MTPSEHLALAEQLLDRARNTVDEPGVSDGLSLALQAQGHALVALAAEFGIPHQHMPTGGTDSGTIG